MNASGTVSLSSDAEYSSGYTLHEAIEELLAEREPDLDEYARSVRATEIALRSHLEYLQGTKGIKLALKRGEEALADIPRMAKCRKWLKNPENFGHRDWRATESWYFRACTNLIGAHAELQRLRWPYPGQLVLW